MIVMTMFQELAAGWADLILPATRVARARRHDDEPRGHGCSGCGARSLPPCPDELAWLSKLAARFEVEVAAACRRRLRGARRAPLPRSRARRASGCRRRSPPRHAVRGARGRDDRSRRPLRAGHPRSTSSASSARTATARSSPAPRSSASPSFGSSAPSARSSSRAPTPSGGGSRPATRCSSARTAPRSSSAPASTGSCVDGRRAGRRRARGRPARDRRGGEGAMTPEWWVSLIQAFVIINLVMVRLRVPHARRAQGDGPDAAPLRPEPRRPVRPPAADRGPAEAAAQGELLPGRGDRLALPARAVPGGVHGARRRSR